MKGVGASVRIWQLADRQPEIPVTGKSAVYIVGQCFVEIKFEGSVSI